MTFDESRKKRQFIDAYYIRRSDETPGMIMDSIGAPKRMLTQWIADPAFRKELDAIDSERVWLAKEVVYRKIGEVFETMANLASQRGPNSIRAAEVMFRVINVGGEKKGKEAEKEESQGGESLDELVRQRDEILSILRTGDEEETGGTESEDREAETA